ncbi:haloacid dehalogenase type II [Herbidospora cretacea]|uniref:haloacid dehalogenase type II n=1 Tax=Herbidospora cretacea TaxID=28444 RepID=UPI0004C3C665|nr:haloacid dehalogenase type II [Herbidospora cretacea]
MDQVLVFDVNETLIDLESMNPLFERIFGDARVVREWFGQLITYSMTTTLSGRWTDFFALGQGVLGMLADVHGVEITPGDVDDVTEAMRTMPAHPDVEAGLTMLRDAGFRLVTLTNSPAVPGVPTPLEHAGLASYFERRFTVEAARAYKPAPQVYHLVTQGLGVPPSACLMVTCHVWDAVGAQSAGFSAGLITRRGNAPLPVAALPQPGFAAPDLPSLAGQIIEGRPG